MKFKISTAEMVVFMGDVKQVTLPTESGELTISSHQKPMVNAIKPGLVKILPDFPIKSDEYVIKDNEIILSIDKGMVFVDGSMVRIISNSATTVPAESEKNLLIKKQDIEEEIKRLRLNGSIEDQERIMNSLAKINADILLEHTKQTI